MHIQDGLSKRLPFRHPTTALFIALFLYAFAISQPLYGAEQVSNTEPIESMDGSREPAGRRYRVIKDSSKQKRSSTKNPRPSRSREIEAEFATLAAPLRPEWEVTLFGGVTLNQAGDSIEDNWQHDILQSPVGKFNFSYVLSSALPQMYFPIGLEVIFLRSQETLSSPYAESTLTTLMGVAGATLGIGYEPRELVSNLGFLLSLGAGSTFIDTPELTSPGFSTELESLNDSQIRYFGSLTAYYAIPDNWKLHFGWQSISTIGCVVGGFSYGF